MLAKLPRNALPSLNKATHTSCGKDDTLRLGYNPTLGASEYVCLTCRKKFSLPLMILGKTAE